jgi:hypothetical protein
MKIFLFSFFVFSSAMAREIPLIEYAGQSLRNEEVRAEFEEAVKALPDYAARREFSKSLCYLGDPVHAVSSTFRLFRNNKSDLIWSLSSTSTYTSETTIEVLILGDENEYLDADIVPCEKEVKCNVSNHKNAARCIEAAAYRLDEEGEIPHSVGVTTSRKGKEAFKTVTGKTARGHYVGLAEVHYDEDEIMYFELDQGEEVSPRLVTEVNVVNVHEENEEEMETEAGRTRIENLYKLYIDTIEGFHLK